MTFTNTKADCVFIEDAKPDAGQGGDDTDAIHEVFEHAVKYRKRVKVLGKTYNCSKPLSLVGDSVEVTGVAPPTRTDRGYTQGSIIRSSVQEGDAFSIVGKKLFVEKLGFVSATKDWGISTRMYQGSRMSDVHVDVVNDKGSGVRVYDSFGAKFREIDVWNATRSKKGVGFWHDTTTDIAGGLLKFDGVWASYFKYGVEFGQEAVAPRRERRTNKLERIQGRHCIKGVRFGNGYGNNKVEGLWGERNEICDVELHSDTGSLLVENINTGSLGSNKPNGVIIGDYCGPLQVTGGTMRMSGAAIVAGVSEHVHGFDMVEFIDNNGRQVDAPPNTVDITRGEIVTL